MPGYRVHDFLTVAAAAALVPGYYALAPRPDPTSAGLLAGACLVSGLLFSPDLDLPSHPHRRWGCAGALWWPYQVCVPHRSWISHSLVIGPLLRLAYFLVMLYAALWGILTIIREWLLPLNQHRVLHAWVSQIERFMRHHPEWVMLVLIGFVAGGLVHTVADVVWSAIRPRRRRWRW
jgi:uncharacterized metal-binding protein